MRISSLIYKYVDHLQFLRKHHIDFMRFCNRQHIDREIEYDVDMDQNGGSNEFPVKHGTIKYVFDYYKATNSINNDKLIFIKRKNQDESLKEFDTNKHCALLSYNDIDKTKLKLDMMQYNLDCIKSTPETKTNGTILLKLIIKFAEYHGFKKIILSDAGTYECIKGDPYSVSYELRYMHTLTHGIPWYSKFKFQFISPDDNDIFEYNKKIMKNLKITDFGLDTLIYVIIRNLSINKHHITFPKYDFISGMYEIMNIHKECVESEKSLCNFFEIITKKQCPIMGCIYMDLFKLLKLEHYKSYDMVLDINQ